MWKHDHPMVVEGQICGGVVQGIGGVLYEHFVYGDDGSPMTTTYVDYLIPTSTDVPIIEIDQLQHQLSRTLEDSKAR